MIVVKFFITEGPLSVHDLSPANFQLQASPNPFNNEITVSYQLEGSSKNGVVTMTDISGRIVSEQVLESPNGKINLGENLNAGIYFIRLKNESGESKTLKVVKTR